MHSQGMQACSVVHAMISVLDPHAYTRRHILAFARMGCHFMKMTVSTLQSITSAYDMSAMVTMQRLGRETWYVRWRHV